MREHASLTQCREARRQAAATPAVDRRAGRGAAARRAGRVGGEPEDAHACARPASSCRPRSPTASRRSRQGTVRGTPFGTAKMVLRSTLKQATVNSTFTRHDVRRARVGHARPRG